MFEQKKPVVSVACWEDLKKLDPEHGAFIRTLIKKPTVPLGRRLEEIDPRAATSLFLKVANPGEPLTDPKGYEYDLRDACLLLPEDEALLMRADKERTKRVGHRAETFMLVRGSWREWTALGVLLKAIGATLYNETKDAFGGPPTISMTLSDAFKNLVNVIADSDRLLTAALSERVHALIQRDAAIAGSQYAVTRYQNDRDSEQDEFFIHETPALRHIRRTLRDRLNRDAKAPGEHHYQAKWRKMLATLEAENDAADREAVTEAVHA